MSRLSRAMDDGYDPGVDGVYECAGCGQDISAGSWCARCMASAYPGERKATA